jgi:alpha-tubulin suppressor-like RCC1 family protein
LNIAKRSTNVPNPQLMEEKNFDIEEISAGYTHTMILKKDGSVWGWGGNWVGQIGDGSSSGKFVPVEIKIDQNKNFVGMGTGVYHTILLQNNTVLTTGYNNHGQLGIDSFINAFQPTKIYNSQNYPAKFVGAGDYHSAFIDTSGSPYCFGQNNVYI